MKKGAAVQKWLCTAASFWREESISIGKDSQKTLSVFKQDLFFLLFG